MLLCCQLHPPRQRCSPCWTHCPCTLQGYASPPAHMSMSLLQQVVSQAQGQSQGAPCKTSKFSLVAVRCSSCFFAVLILLLGRWLVGHYGATEITSAKASRFSSSARLSCSPIIVAWTPGFSMDIENCPPMMPRRGARGRTSARCRRRKWRSHLSRAALVPNTPRGGRKRPCARCRPGRPPEPHLSSSARGPNPSDASRTRLTRRVSPDGHPAYAVPNFPNPMHVLKGLRAG